MAQYKTIVFIYFEINLMAPAEGPDQPTWVSVAWWPRYTFLLSVMPCLQSLPTDYQLLWHIVKSQNLEQ